MRTCYSLFPVFRNTIYYPPDGKYIASTLTERSSYLCLYQLCGASKQISTVVFRSVLILRMNSDICSNLAILPFHCNAGRGL